MPPLTRSVVSSLWARRQVSVAIHERVTRRSGYCDTTALEAAWDRYWAPLFSAQVEPEVVSAARKLALEQDVADPITGVRAFYDRRDHSEFLRTWSGQLLVVSGHEDRTPTPATAARSVEGTGATQVIVEGSGHYVPLERPYVLHRAIEKQLRILRCEP